MDDKTALDSLLARSFPPLLKSHYDAALLTRAMPLLSRAQPELLRSGHYFVAEDSEGELCAAGGWSPVSRRGIGRVRHVVTDCRRLRQGFGRAILNAIFTDARSQDVTYLQCQSALSALGFYEALGFSFLGPIALPLGPGVSFPAVALERRL